MLMFIGLIVLVSKLCIALNIQTEYVIGIIWGLGIIEAINMHRLVLYLKHKDAE